MVKKSDEISFVPKTCPRCGEMLVIKRSGCWGYWCIKDMFWWGKIDDYPKEPKKTSGKK
jgi:hypothetical protein